MRPENAAAITRGARANGLPPHAGALRRAIADSCGTPV